MKSLDLFDYQPPAQRHSPTSKAAAEQIKRAISPLHNRILAALKLKPMTDEEMQDSLKMSANTQRPRRRELQIMGKIMDCGQTRLCRSGRSAVVWRIAQ